MSLSLMAQVPGTALGWGEDGHKVVGALALAQLQPEAAATLSELMGTADLDTLTDWCNWPDAYRETEDGAWSAPLHYVNLPRGSGRFDPERDCPGDQCVTRAIPTYASILGDVTSTRDNRQRAFAFVCHFVGDLSQSLHAGFGDDRGGNDFTVILDGVELNLHELWDSVLIERHSDSWLGLFAELSENISQATSETWSPSLVEAWTEQSHELAANRAYPPEPKISPEFEQESWQMVRRQLQIGGRNLALILGAMLEADGVDQGEGGGRAAVAKDPAPP